MEAVKFKTVSFRAGAYVYIEEQIESSEFYIVQRGSLIEENPLNSLTEEPDLIIKAGDFFGVLECMSQRARLSSIKVLEDSVLIIVKFDQFESLITQMAPVAMKIIRYFSHRLRKYNTALSHLASENMKSMEHHTSSTLFTLGEYYQTEGKNLLAGYAFTKFIEMFPYDSDIEKARQYLQVLNNDPSSIQPVQQGIQKIYEAGTPIFLEMEEGEDMYIIVEGFVKISKLVNKTEVLLGMLKEKDVFGEMAILENIPRSASAVAATRTTLLCINKKNFELYIKTYPEIARRIIQLLSDRIWLIYKRLANQLISDPSAKIYDALRTLLQKNRIPLRKGLAHAFEMSPDDVVQFIGMDPSIGQKVMAQVLQSDPVLYVENNQLISKDVYSIRGAISSSSRSRTRHAGTSKF
ncbi:MAG: Crp/Fnr family transcriptional regulator [Brevinema sp.]